MFERLEIRIKKDINQKNVGERSLSFNMQVYDSQAHHLLSLKASHALLEFSLEGLEFKTKTMNSTISIWELFYRIKIVVPLLTSTITFSFIMLSPYLTWASKTRKMSVKLFVCIASFTIISCTLKLPSSISPTWVQTFTIFFKWLALPIFIHLPFHFKYFSPFAHATCHHCCSFKPSTCIDTYVKVRGF